MRMEILRVLADGTGTSPMRSAVFPLARSFRYQLDWKGSASHSAFIFVTRVSMMPPLVCCGRSSEPGRYSIAQLPGDVIRAPHSAVLRRSRHLEPDDASNDERNADEPSGIRRLAEQHDA